MYCRYTDGGNVGTVGTKGAMGRPTVSRVVNVVTSRSFGHSRHSGWRRGCRGYSGGWRRRWRGGEAVGVPDGQDRECTPAARARRPPSARGAASVLLSFSFRADSFSLFYGVVISVSLFLSYCEPLSLSLTAILCPLDVASFICLSSVCSLVLTLFLDPLPFISFFYLSFFLSIYIRRLCCSRPLF